MNRAKDMIKTAGLGANIVSGAGKMFDKAVNSHVVQKGSQLINKGARKVGLEGSNTARENLKAVGGALGTAGVVGGISAASGSNENTQAGKI